MKVQSLLAAVMMSSASLSYGSTFAQTALVSAVGGDYMTPEEALYDIDNWCGTPSVDQRCLIKLMPGTYDIGSETFAIPSYVSLIGSGREVTTITDSGADTTVETGDETELAHLHIDAGTDLHKNITGILARGNGVYVHNVSVNVPRPGVNFTHGINFFGKSNGEGLGGSASAHDIDINMELGVSGDNYGIRSLNELTLSNVNVNVKGGFISRGIFLSAKYSLNHANIEMTPVSTTVRTSGLSVSAPSALGLGTVNNVRSFINAQDASGTAYAVAVNQGHQTNKAFLSNLNAKVRGGRSDSIGLYVDTAPVHVSNSQFSGATAAVQTVNVGPKSLLTTSTLLQNSIVHGAGASLNCTALTDENFNFIPYGCPVAD